MRSPDRGSTTGAASWTDHEHSEWAARRASEASQSPPSPPYSKKSSYESASFFFRILHSVGDEKPRPGVRQLAQPVGQTTNTVSGLPAGRAKRVNPPPLTAIFKEELVRKYGFFSHFICLYGSERYKNRVFLSVGFLSCLYGSELKYYTSSPLLIKQNHLIFPATTLFLSLPSRSTNYQQITIIIKKKGQNLLHPINKKSVTSFEITDFTNLPNN